MIYQICTLYAGVYSFAEPTKVIVDFYIEASWLFTYYGLALAHSQMKDTVGMQF